MSLHNMLAAGDEHGFYVQVLVEDGDVGALAGGEGAAVAELRRAGRDDGGGLDSGLAARRRPVHPLRRGARRRMKRGKRSVRSGMLIRLLAILYLPYLMFSMYRNYTSGEAGVSLALFIALMAVMGIAEIAIAVSAVRLWLGHYKEEEKED